MHPGTQALAEAIRPHVPVSNAVLLKNHGALTYGKDLTDAYNKMEVLESIAKTIIMSKILGDLRSFPDKKLPGLLGIYVPICDWKNEERKPLAVRLQITWQYSSLSAICNGYKNE